MWGKYKDPERLYPVWNIRRYCRMTPQIIFITLWTVFLFSADCRNASVSTNSKKVDLRHSHSVNMFYFSGLSFRDTQRVWVFRVWVSETSKRLSFLGLSFGDTQGSEFFRGLSFRDTRGSEFFGSGVWVFETPEHYIIKRQKMGRINSKGRYLHHHYHHHHLHHYLHHHKENTAVNKKIKQSWKRCLLMALT